MKKISICLLALLLCFSLCLAACGDDVTPTPPAEETPPSSETPPAGENPEQPGSPAIPSNPASDFVFEELSDGTYQVAAYVGTTPVVVIPSTYNDKPVTVVGENSFEDNITITSVIIPDSVTLVDEGAFYDCDAMTAVVIGNGVKTIGEGAFKSCTALSSVTFGNHVEVIDDNAFENGLALTSITLPNSLKRIGEGAFDECVALSSVVISDSVTEIGRYAFGYCLALAHVTIGSSVTMIDDDAFDGCENLFEVYNRSALTITMGDRDTNGGVAAFAKNVYTPTSGASKIKLIDDYVFYADGDEIYLMAYQGTDKALVLPDGCDGKPYAICQNVFYYRQDLTALTIPDSVTAVGNRAFYNCEGITSISLGNGLKTLGEEAFAYCPITTVTIGEQMESIGEVAFYSPRLIEVYNRSKLTITAGSEEHGCVAAFAKNVYTTPDGSHLVTSGDYLFYVDGDEIYLCTYNGTEPALTLPDGYEGKPYGIYHFAFAERTELVSVTIPAGVSSIGDGAFEYCDKLASVTLSTGLVRIGESAFARCDALTTISLPASVKEIGESAFASCDALTAVTIPDGVEAISRNTFGGCMSLTTVTLPDSITAIGESAFSYCSALTSITLGNRVESIGSRAFSRCEGLTSVTIPDSVKTLGESAFEYCISLVSVTLGSGLETIDNHCFSSCYHLTEVCNRSTLSLYKRDYNSAENIYTPETGASKLVTVGTAIFYVDGENIILVHLAEAGPAIVLPDGYNGKSYTIGKYLFRERRDIVTVTIPDSVTGIGYEAFYACASLETVYMGKGITAVDDYAFGTPISLSNPFNHLKAVHITDLAAWCKIDFSNFQSNPLHVAHHLYLNGTEVTELVIPDGVTAIGAHAFTGASALTSVTMGDSVETIGESAFTGCTSLLSATIGSGVTAIGNYAFSSCIRLIEVCNRSALTITAGSEDHGNVAYYAQHVYATPDGSKLTADGDFLFFANGDTIYLMCYTGTGNPTLPNDYQSKSYKIVTSAFAGRTDITSITIPAGVTCIGEDAFADCLQLTEVIIGSGVTRIENRAFSGCSALTSLTLGDHVEYIGQHAFEDGAFTTLTIPASVKEIGEYAFGWCSQISAIHISDLSAWCGITFEALRATPLYWCDASLYLNGTEITALVIPSGITEIKNFAFYGLGCLTSVTIGNEVESIGEFAFIYCENLTTVTIGDSVRSIGESAFAECTNLTSVTIGNGVESIGDQAFCFCKNLTTVTIGANVTSIGRRAFSSCGKLSSATFANTENWSVEDLDVGMIPLDVTDPATAAIYLTRTYAFHDWTRTEA